MEKQLELPLYRCSGCGMGITLSQHKYCETLHHQGGVKTTRYWCTWFCYTSQEKQNDPNESGLAGHPGDRYFGEGT